MVGKSFASTITSLLPAKKVFAFLKKEGEIETLFFSISKSSTYS